MEIQVGISVSGGIWVSMISEIDEHKCSFNNANNLQIILIIRLLC